MPAKYDFKLYNPDPSKITGWVPVMWAKNKIDISFTAPSNWTAVDFKAFQVHPSDSFTKSGWTGVSNAEGAKNYILANDTSGINTATYDQWDPGNDRYNDGSAAKNPTFKVKTKSSGTIVIEDKHNRSATNYVYDFLIHFTDGNGKHILVDPRIRNEY